MTKPVPPGTKGKSVVRITALTQAHIIKLMLEGVYSCRELAEMSGAHYVTVLNYARALHRVGAAHICQYEPDLRGRDMTKIYKIGAGKDVQRRRKSGAEKQRLCRARKRAANDDLVRAGLATYVVSANGRLRFEPIKASA